MLTDVRSPLRPTKEMSYQIGNQYRPVEIHLVLKPCRRHLRRAFQSVIFVYFVLRLFRFVPSDSSDQTASKFLSDLPPRSFLSSTVDRRLFQSAERVLRYSMTKRKSPSSPSPSSDESDRESTSPPLTRRWGPKDIDGTDYVEVLKKLEHVPARYLDENTLNALGISEDVTWFFDKVGLTKFISLKCDIYETPTVEFLATVKVEFDGEYSRKSCPSTGSLTFLHGKEPYFLNRTWSAHGTCNIVNYCNINLAIK